MRLNNSYSFKLLILGAVVISSCSRATYSEKAKELKVTPLATEKKDVQMSLEADQSLEMKEGEIKTFRIKLASPATKDATILWSLHPQASNPDIKPADRFKQIDGALSVKANEQELIIEIPAQEVNPDEQGDQMFSLLLVSTETQMNSSLNLKLIDVVIKKDRSLPTKATLLMNFQLSHEAPAAILSLNEKSEEDIIVEIETKDQTAIALKDYLPIKKTITIPAGLQTIDIPYQILAKPCNMEKAFMILIKNVSGAEALAKEIKVTIPTDANVNCEEKTTPRKPKATWN